MTAQQSTHIKAATGTIVIHAILLLLMIFLTYSMPVTPVVEDLGIEVNLGTSDDGGGSDQPMAVEAPAPDAASMQQSSYVEAATASRQVLTSDDPEAPIIQPPAEVTPARSHRSDTKPKREKDPNGNRGVQQREKAAQPRYVYSGGTGRGGNNAANSQAGQSEGDGNGPGDKGVPGGTPGAANYSGSPGNGTGGISHTLRGRSISPNSFTAEFNEGGRVVIRVKVDRNGTILSKTVKSSPNQTLSNIALQKLSQAKFSANPDAAPEQMGDVTFVFKTRPQ